MQVLGIGIAGLGVVACCAAFTARRRRINSANARYEMLRMTEEALESSENSLDEDYNAMVAAEEEARRQAEDVAAAAAAARRPPPPEEDLLGGFAVRAELATPAGATPCCGSCSATPAGCSTADSSTTQWIDEMNAEIAEFDAITSVAGQPRASTGSRPSDGGAGWQEAMEAELRQQLSSPR